MIKTNILFFLTFLLAIFSVGCANKTIYEPKSTDGKIKYNKTIKNAVLKNVVREGAMLSDLKVVTKEEGVIELVLPKGFLFVNENDNSVIAADEEGNLKIFSKDGYKESFSKKFDAQVISASLKGSLLALVFSNNSIMLYDIKTDKVLYQEQLDKVIAVDARAANPIFLNDIIIYPTLDGRLLIMDSIRKTVLRDVAISDKELFNNVIFLKVYDNILVAATASKVIVITPENIYTYTEDIKDILYIGHDIYLFAKSGKVIHLDEKLQKVSEKDFEFANFIAVASMGDKLYAVEKNGYLIEMDRSLSNIKVKKLDDEVESASIFANGVLYIGDKEIKLR